MDGLAARLGRPTSRLAARVPLRVNLVTAAVCLVATGCAIIGAASAGVVRGYLIREADLQLRACADRLISRPSVVTPDSGPVPGCSSSVGFSIEVLGPGGMPILPPRPGLGAGSAMPAASQRISAHAGQLATIRDRYGASWRVLAEPIDYRARRIPFVYGADDFFLLITSRATRGVPATLVVGANLASISQAVGRLSIGYAAVSSIMILIVAVVGCALIHAALRPLTEMTRAAEMIAAGEMCRRVPDHDPRSETGRVGWSVNSMLNETEHVARERAESEATARGDAECIRGRLSDIGNELRRSLNVIGGFTEYYRAHGPLRAGELDRMMRRVKTEAARMNVLADDLLAAARPNRRHPQRPEPRKARSGLAAACAAASSPRHQPPGESLSWQATSERA